MSKTEITLEALPKIAQFLCEVSTAVNTLWESWQAPVEPEPLIPDIPLDTLPFTTTLRCEEQLMTDEGYESRVFAQCGSPAVWQVANEGGTFVTCDYHLAGFLDFDTANAVTAIDPPS